ETAIKENEELKKTQQETSKQFKECCVRYEREDVESKRKFEALVSIVHWLNKASQTADAETAVKVVDSSVTTQANTTTAGPVITNHSLPSDGVQVLPSQGVPQGLNSSTPLPPRDAMRGARVQSYRGPCEYVNQDFSSHRSITFQEPLVQSEHSVEGEHGYVDPYYEEPTDLHSIVPQVDQSNRGIFPPSQQHSPPQQHPPPQQYYPSQQQHPPPQQFPPHPPQQQFPPRQQYPSQQQFLPPQQPQQQFPPQQPPQFQQQRQPQGPRVERRKIPINLCPRFGERYDNRDFNTFEWEFRQICLLYEVPEEEKLTRFMLHLEGAIQKHGQCFLHSRGANLRYEDLVSELRRSFQRKMDVDEAENQL
ncbi:MAG: hypothetical protein GY820_17170, partial [Gammaproteobacteria bacterium]|nr:hypothetical protein [Gammaproteobacteria bacterium]